MTATTTASDPARILVVDDSPDMLEVLARNLETAGHRVFTAGDPEDALRVLDRTRVDLVVTDLRMPRGSGLDLVRHVRENLRDTEVMIVTGYASVAGAVEAVKAWAEEYLAKPFTDTELRAAVARALEKLHIRRQAEGASVEPHPIAGLLGSSASMRAVLRAVTKAAASTATVLITGESGTGKELVARATHYRSPRAAAPFVAVNCGGIPDTLIESELFGYVRGAFTGAHESRAGFFQTADGGTLFLDEIGDVSLAMQVKLLRVLQEKEVCMVGSTRPRSVDVRVVAATNKDLPLLVRRGTFREDLFFRLAVLTIDVGSVSALSPACGTARSSTAARRRKRLSPRSSSPRRVRSRTQRSASVRTARTPRPAVSRNRPAACGTARSTRSPTAAELQEIP